MNDTGIDRTLYEENAVLCGQQLRGVVVNREDPRLEGRVAVVIPRLVQSGDPVDFSDKGKKVKFETDFLENEEMGDLITGEVNTTNSMWARPIRKPAWRYHIPYVGQTVYCIMEDGDPDKLYYLDQGPSLQGDNPPMTWLRDAESNYSVTRKPNVHLLYEFHDTTTVYFNENVDKREFRVFNLPENTYLTAYENNDNKYVELQSPIKKHAFVMSEQCNDAEMRVAQIENGFCFITEHGHTIRLDDAVPNILIETGSGHKMELNDSGNFITITTSGGSKIHMTGDGNTITMTNTGGAKTDMSGAQITHSAGGGKIVIGGGKVKIN